MQFISKWSRWLLWWLGRGQTQSRGKETIHQCFNDLGFSYSQGMGWLSLGKVWLITIGWSGYEGVALLFQGSYIKAALFLKCFLEKAWARANITRAGVNSILSIPVHCNSFYSIQFISINNFSIPSIIILFQFALQFT